MESQAEPKPLVKYMQRIDGMWCFPEEEMSKPGMWVFPDNDPDPFVDYSSARTRIR